jgi:2-succinyl-5-enolpyruvyl-6-hydroxy-3-cyclohexene-1-carboxylate synthase
MSRFQSIYDIAALSAKKGLRHAVLCPGSRCAPLTLAFSRHPAIECKTISDERSAAFIALGISQASHQPAVLVCTSGTAAYNFAPAVAEAYFSRIPLIILTADRPTEWIDQLDGQTIYQSGLYGKHVKRSYQLPQEYEHPDNGWAINRIINEAINLARQEPGGPVHINAPFREPLYPLQTDTFSYSDAVRVIEDSKACLELDNTQKEDMKKAWPSFHNVLIVAGQLESDNGLIASLTRFFNTHNIPIVADVISNLHSIEKLVSHADLFLGQCGDEVRKTLRPDLLITFGRSTISKNLKLFLRKYSPVQHWHVQEDGDVADTFQHITNIIRCAPAKFFGFLASVDNSESFENQRQNNYHKLWEIEERRLLRSLHEHLNSKEFGELELVNEIIQTLPPGSNLHLANSMSVRYANFIGLKASHQNVSVYSNRGTSGIDGCTSTAVGHALSSQALNVLITGDQAFFYDRNAFWHNYATPNLRVVLLNNHGGIIFKMIDGPGDTPEAAEYFVTDQRLTAKHLCNEFGFEYLKLDNKRKVKNLIQAFFETDGKAKVLEFETDLTMNKTLFENLKHQIRKNYEL